MKNILNGYLAVIFLFLSSQSYAANNQKLIDALVKDDIQAVTLALDSGLDVNQKYDSRYPIHIATDYSKVEILSLLIERGAHLDVQDEQFGYSPLHIATAHQMLEKIELLVAKGANPNLLNKSDGLSSLHWAARGYVEATKLLLKSPLINVNIQDKSGWTPMMTAASSSQPSFIIVELLVNKGADKSKINSNGKTALDLA